LDHPYRIEQIGPDTVIVYVAAAYRAPDDLLPGIGTAMEIYPGKTPYTRGSEIQNAETSAWGRAIVAALAADTKKGISSQEEIRNREADRKAKPSSSIPGLFEAITTARDYRELKAAWEQVSTAKHAGQIRPEEADQLGQHVHKLKKELADAS
jgi:hypothetical protein